MGERAHSALLAAGWIRLLGAVIHPPLDSWIWLLPAFLIGACIGSFLNVVIYRLPKGLSVNDPKRSFCPGCRKEIPMKRNVPLLSWLLLRGKCADCGMRIPSRYFWVELLTAVLFTAVWAWLAGRIDPLNPSPALAALLPLWFLAAAFVAITFIDSEHLIIPLELTIPGLVAGLLASVLLPVLPDLSGWASPVPDWKQGLWQALLGGVIGFFGIWGVVLLGKLAFGRRKLEFDAPVAWRLEESPDEEGSIGFHMGEERIDWWDIFYRPSDRLLIECATLKVDGQAVDPGGLVIREGGIELPDGRQIAIEELRQLEGTAARAVIPREAMGMGDAHLMGVIGAFFGWTGVFFSLLAASLYAIVAALLGRIGFGMRLPFGPFLVLGALSWLFGAWKLGAWYFALLR